MIRSFKGAALALALAGLATAAISPALAQKTSGPPLPHWATGTASGVVFEDTNADGAFDPDDRALAGIRVSNGRTIVRTGSDGRYTIPITDDCNIFVIKPRNYRTAVDENMLPRFYYTHKPNGSPESRFPGVAPTGPLPASVDFPLTFDAEPDVFRAVFWADPQPRDLKEIEYITHDVIEELVGVDAAFGVTLGDIMFDDISLFEEQNTRVAMIGIPWYNVIGNHDLNYDAREDKYSDETFERVFGPNYYSFDYGPTHFIALDDVNWYYDEGEKRGKYHGGLNKEQLEFVKNDLAMIPEDQLVVLMMHIPLTNIGNRQELYRLIEQRPYCMSISGHTHYQEHKFVTQADGWKGPKPHHHAINVTVSGSWWSGVKDERGIPHTTMRDGAPNGYSIITFNGTEYDIEFKAARFPADYQMNIMTPEEVVQAETGATEVVVNVFGGSSHSSVEMRVAGGDWMPLEKVERVDPWFAAMKSREKKWVGSLEAEAAKERVLPFGRTLPNGIKSSHLWAAKLPADLPVGKQLIEVRTTDMFGKTYTAERVIAVR
ncbi:MAG: hypothetical protein PWP23_459 [Candidatus Sumerlaeota bacterium]|nr:hypothetical protein [Candidatus Sumerlaeota bacterium]